MKTAIRLALLALVVGVVSLAPVSFDTLPSVEDASALATFNQDPGEGGSGGSCDYCNQTACGCASPPPQCTLSYSCACSSLTCTRSCDFNC